MTPIFSRVGVFAAGALMGSLAVLGVLSGCSVDVL
jgi:hypothetical protein